MMLRLICLVRRHQWHNGWDEERHLTVWTCKRCGSSRTDDRGNPYTLDPSSGGVGGGGGDGGGADSADEPQRPCDTGRRTAVGSAPLTRRDPQRSEDTRRWPWVVGPWTLSMIWRRTVIAPRTRPAVEGVRRA